MNSLNPISLNKKYFTSNIPSLGRDTLGLGPPGDSGAVHSGDNLGLDSPIMTGGGHFRQTLGLGTPDTLWGWASGVGHSKNTPHSRETLGLGILRETLKLNTPGRLWRWALQQDPGTL